MFICTYFSTSYHFCSEMELLIMLVAVLSVFAYSAPNFGESETLYFNYFIGRGMPKNQNAGGCPVYLRPLYYWRSLHYLHHLLCQILFFILFIIVLLKGFTSREKQIWTRGDWIIIPKCDLQSNKFVNSFPYFLFDKIFPWQALCLKSLIFKFGSFESRAWF